MRRIKLKGMVTASCLLALLLGSCGVLWAQAASDDLAVKFRTAQDLYEKGDYAGSRTLLLEVRESISTAGTRIPAETMKAIDARLAEIDARLAAKPVSAEQAPVGGETTTAEATAGSGDAEKRFEEMRNDPAILKQMAEREAAASAVSRPTEGDGTQQRFGEALRDEDVRRQLVEQEVRAKLVEGLILLGQNRFEDANRKFLAAQTQVQYASFSDEWKKLWLGRVQEHLDRSAADKLIYDKVTDDERVTKATEEMQKHFEAQRRLQNQQFVQLMEQWEIFFMRKQYDDALLVLHQAQKLKPQDTDLAKKMEMTRRERLQWIATTSGLSKAHEIESTLQQVNEVMTPWAGYCRYPDDWKELSDRRIRATQQREERETPENRAVRQKLEETVVSFVFNDQPVREAVEYLGTVGNVNVVLDASKLPDPAQTITLKLTNVSLETAIRLLTEQLTLKYTVRDGAVYVSDAEGVKLEAETVVYEVRDLLASLPEFTGPSFELGQLSQSSRGSGGGSGSVWGGGGGGGTGGGTGTSEETTESPEESLAKLIDLVKSVIDPGTWEDGSGNAIQGRSGTIIVTHTPEVHRLVQQLLVDLRRSRAIQVVVDIRFVTVTDAFMEQFGINLGDGTTSGIVWTDTHWNIDASSITTVSPQAGAVPFGSTSTGLNLSGAFMDDVTVNFFLDAVQRSTRGTVTNAPRLTMMNGQRAYVAVSEQTNYVEDITSTVAEGAVGFDPTIATVQDGVVFDVRPTVSADRRYVQLDLRPSVATLVSIDNFMTILPSMISPGAYIQLPKLQVSMVRCSVSVPDGGTLMVGGLNYGFEADVEAGVPVLSNIPLIGKAFSHRAIDQEKRSLVILVKPTIIIQEEYEAKVE